MASSPSSPEIYSAEPFAQSQSRFSYKEATQEEVLEDLSSRFILNLPDEELNSLERVCFQVEQAHWFYEDFIREQNTKLPSMPLKKFSEMLFHACPLLQQWSHDHEEAFKNFMQYKTQVPVCGAIMLNDAMDKCVLVKGWKASSNWGFPKGKINETEPPVSCAIREVLEETGYNIAAKIDPANVIELTIKEQRISLFIVPGIPENFNFQTKTRKEISQIAWFNVSDLPTWKKNKTQVPNRKFYLIAPFIGPLKNFIHEKRQRSEKKNGKQRNPTSDKGNGSGTGYGSHTKLQRSETVSSAVNGSPAPSHLRENELGPELTRLFSGLTALSHRTNGSNMKAADSSSDDPSDSSLDSPMVSRARQSSESPSSSRQSFVVPVSSTVTASSLPPSTPSPMTGVKASQTELQPPLNQDMSPSTSPTRPTIATRKTSATADISPYLSSKSELSVSTKTLQHLKLLETVADESARMAPILAARAAMVRQATVPNVPTPSPSSHVLSHLPDLLYSTVQSPNAAAFPPRQAVEGLTHYPFSLRSRTSQSFNRPTMHNPTGSMSVHQNHLLAVINGARSVPVTPNYPMNQQFMQHHSQPLYNPVLSVIHPPTTMPGLSSTTSYPYVLPPPSNPVLPASGPISPTANPHTYSHPQSTASVFIPLPDSTQPGLVPYPGLPSVYPGANSTLTPGVNMGASAPVVNPLLSVLNGRPV